MNKELYRPNVGVLVLNKKGKVLVFKRADIEDEGTWQMPQGGIDDNKNHIDAGYRELEEETTITKEQTEFIDFWDEFQKYDSPKGEYIRDGKVYRGQKQKWLIVRYIGNKEIHLENAHDYHHNENNRNFKKYKWVSMDKAIELVWLPKKEVYKSLAERYAHLLS